MLGEALKPLLQAYFLLEEQYYKLMDVLEERASLPVYDFFVEPIESRGIPSFIVALLLFILLAGGSLLVLTASAAPSLQVSVYGKIDATHAVPLDGAVVEVSDDSGVLFKQAAKKGKITFANIPMKVLTVKASKEGFKPDTANVDASAKNVIRLELACSDAKTCAELASQIGEPGEQPYGTPTPQVGPTYPGTGDDKWSFCEGEDCDDEGLDSGTGRLLVQVKDAQGTPLDARASVYDAATNGLIQALDVVQGSGLVPSLPVGKEVYVNVLAEGFAPYFGNESGVTIRPATNRLSVTLRAGNGSYVGPCVIDCDLDGPVPAGKVRIHVVEANGTGIDNAEVSVFLPDRPEVLYTDYTYDGGRLLLTVGNGSYFAVAQAEGHITNNSALFQGGQDVTIVLPAIQGGGGCTGSNCGQCQPDNCPGPGQNEAQVLVRVTDESNASAAYADIVLQQRTEFGSWFVLDQQNADNQGRARFPRLLIGAQVKAKATLYEQSGEANATLVQGVNPLEVRIARTPFTVTAYGYDPLSRQYVQAARFSSFLGNRTIGSCEGNGCRLRILSGEDVTINVSAEGYVGSERTVYLYEGIESNVTLYLVNTSALSDTFVQWDGLYTEQNRPVSGNLRPGSSYLAKLQVFSRDAEQSGVVLDTRNDDVSIVGLNPAGFEVKGSYADSCYPSNVDFDRDRMAWVDSRYNGAASGAVVFNVSLEPTMALDQRTRTKVVSFGYRSYILRGGQYLRNPFDPALSTQPGQSHPSGCPAAMYSRNYTAKSSGTTCNGQACISLRFSQGSESGTQDFDARNQVLVSNRKLDPFFVYYTVEFFTRPGENTRLQLQAPASGLLVFNATSPIKGPSPLGTAVLCEKQSLKARSFEVLNASFGLDLGNITRCTNYAETGLLKYSFEGVAKGRVLEAGLANISLVLTGLNATAPALVHSAFVRVSGFGVAADENGIVEAELGQGENDNADAATYSALSTGNCSSSQVLNRQCDVGFLNATFRVTALQGSSIAVQTAVDSGLTLYDLQPSSPTTVLLRGQSVTGVALYLVPNSTGTPNVTITRELGSQSTSLERQINLGGAGFSFNGSEPFPPGWDTCNGYIGLKYDSVASPHFTLGNGCTDLAFRVTPIFPADSILLNVSMPDYGQILTRASATDGSEKCYEICDLESNGGVFGCNDLGKTLYGNQQYLLRYNPELRTTCPAQYKVQGNRLARSQVTLEFSFTGDQTSKRNVTLRVLNDESDSSLYISPVYTMYSSSGRLFPQLWAVTNLKQFGPRTIVFKQPAAFALKFNGPGTQVVAMMAGNVQAFDGTDLERPILDLQSAGSPLYPVSRYSLALAALYRSIDLNIPGFQDYSRALAASLDASSAENSFLDSNAATALSDAVPKLAGRTAYWRSSDVTRYCEQSSQCVSSYYTLPNCCRESLDDWRNKTVSMDFRQEACTFCNNTYNPSCTDSTAQHLAQYSACTYGSSSSIYQCDQRCVLKTSLPAYMLDAVNQLGVPGDALTIRDYGDTVQGQKCQLIYSSLNAFVEFTPGTNSYTYYTPSNPKTSLTADSVSRCQTNGQCPLLIASAADTFVGGTVATPKCAQDLNGDGLWQANEPTTPATFTRGRSCNQQSFNCNPAPDMFTCPVGQIMAVDESVFFSPAVTNGVLTPRSVATAADIQKCRSGPCPLMITPATEPTFPNTPMCFTGPTENGFLTVTTAGRANFVPAQATGFGGFQCPSGNLAVAKQCFASCTNYCETPNCDSSPLCLAQGVKIVPTGTSSTTDNGWLNKTTVIAVRMDTAFLSRGKKLAPASYFPDMFQASKDEFQNSADGKPVFSASYVVNSKNSPNGLSSLPKVLNVDGCGGSDYPYDQSLLPNQGVYQIRDYATVDDSGATWASEAKAVDLLQSNYVGARSELCRKPKWDTRLCETTFVDHSSQYGNCFNSILQYSAGPKKLGVDLSLVGGLGLGVKSGTGYAVTPDGQAFALIDAGQHYAGICGSQAQGIDPTHGYDDKHKYDVDKQTLHHWRNDGRYDASRDFYWQKDLGCSKDCGCKKGGGYGLLQILLPLILMALAFFVIGPAIAAMTTTTTATLGTTTWAISSGAASTLSGVFGATITTTVGISAATAGAISAAVLTAATSGLTGGAGTVVASAASIASNVISSVGVGNLGDCIPWAFGTATVWACKGALWTLSGG